MTYRSLRKPWLKLEADDVWPCEECGGDGERVITLHEYNQTIVVFCPACQGYGRIHGFTIGGEAMPVEEIVHGADDLRP